MHSVDEELPRLTVFFISLYRGSRPRASRLDPEAVHFGCACLPPQQPRRTEEERQQNEALHEIPHSPGVGWGPRLRHEGDRRRLPTAARRATCRTRLVDPYPWHSIGA